MRCERVISKDDSPLDPREVSGRWLKQISNRAALDRKTVVPKSPKKAQIEATIKETWTETGLGNESSYIQEDGQSGVLVSSGLSDAGVG